MEFSPENDNPDDLLGGKKKKKEKSQAYLNDPHQEARLDEARSDILRLFTKNDLQEVAQPSQPHAEVLPGVDDLTAEALDDQPNLADLENTDLPLAGSDHETLVKPENVDTAADDFNQARPSSYWEQANQQVPEPVRPVYGYNPDGNDFYKGYVPGVAAENADAAPLAGHDGGANIPPRTPNNDANAMPEPEDSLPPQYNRSDNPVNRLAQAREAAKVRPERSGGFSREAMVAAVLTTIVVTAYLKNRKINRQQKEFNKELASQQKQINELEDDRFRQETREAAHEQHVKQVEDENRKLAERLDQKLAAQAQAASKLESQPKTQPTVERPKPVIVSPTKSPLEKPKPEQESEDKKLAEQIDMLEAARRALEEASNHDNKRVEQDAWLRHELDEHGQEVQGQVRGQEYTHERAQELMQRQPHDQQSDRKAVAEPSFGGSQTYQQSASQQHPALSSGQVPADHRLTYDAHHDYSSASGKKQNALVSTLTSPWTFLMLSIILLAYFIATLL